MLTDLLWAYGAKRQYDIIKSTGAAGALALLLVLLIVWQWDNFFFPLIDFLGFTAFAESMGAVSESGGVTFVNLYYLTLMIAYIFTFAMALPSFIMLTLCVIIKSKFLRIPCLLIAALLMSPVFFIASLIKKKTDSKAFKNSLFKKLLKEEPVTEFLESCDTTQNEHIEGYTFIAQEFLKGANQRFLTTSEAQKKLNKIAVDYKMNTNDWLLGYSSNESKWYLLTYNPLPAYVSKCAFEKTEGKDHFNFLKISSENDNSFYAISTELNFTSNEFMSTVHSGNENDFKFRPINIHNLDEIIELSDSTSFQELMNNVLKSRNYQHIMSEAISRTFTIPYFHPKEVFKYDQFIKNKQSNLFTNDSFIYYAELYKLEGGTSMTAFGEELSNRKRLVALDRQENYLNFIRSQKHLSVV